eukprot:snap_masked-scaffold_46-processed-gene-1.23-mRNA-1 protein AED:1.00 eAED:1.00 QI:0/-1/0/0/-1/1/1/0/65
MRKRRDSLKKKAEEVAILCTRNIIPVTAQQDRARAKEDSNLGAKNTISPNEPVEAIAQEGNESTQ